MNVGRASDGETFAFAGMHKLAILGALALPPRALEFARAR